MEERQYLCIDQKSFYATVECVERGLDPMKAKLVVADQERSENTICLAVSPALKALGVKNRCRIKEVPPRLNAIVAEPRMQLYIDYAAEIHGVFLKYIAPFDIHTYSIDESFLDVTPYLKMYSMTAPELALKIMQDVKDTVGTICTCGVGTNLYLAKIALDIKAKHAKNYIGILDEESYCREMWDHKPITDFWRISDGTAARLKRYGITTLGGVAHCHEDLLYRAFGIDAEILYDHAWGREPVTIADIKGYKSKSKSLSNGQVLMRDYSFREALVIAKEMINQLSLKMVHMGVATESVSLYVGYSYTQGVPGSGGTAKLSAETNADMILIPAIEALYRRIVSPAYVIRRVCVACNNLVEYQSTLQLSMFEDTTKQIRCHALQETQNLVNAKYGPNTLMRGVHYDPAATGRERNLMIGGHKSGQSNSQGTDAAVPESKDIRAL